MIRAPQWKVENQGDCREILRKGIAKGQTNVKFVAIIPEDEE